MVEFKNALGAAYVDGKDLIRSNLDEIYEKSYVKKVFISILRNFESLPFYSSIICCYKHWQ